MNKTFLCSLALSALTVSFVDAATLSVTPGGTGMDFKYVNGNLINDTSPHHIRVGYFSNYIQTGTNTTPLAGLDFRNLLKEPTSSIFQTIQTYFVPLGEGRTNLGQQTDWSITPLTGGLAGKFSVNTTLNSDTLQFTADAANSVSANGLPRGTRLFVLAYNTEDFSLATEVGIYSGSSGTVGQWYVPTTAATSVTLNLGLIDISSLDATDGTGLEIFRGGEGSLVLGAVVPEPSTGLIAGLAGALMMMRRRR